MLDITALEQQLEKLLKIQETSLKLLQILTDQTNDHSRYDTLTRMVFLQQMLRSFNSVVRTIDRLQLVLRETDPGCSMNDIREQITRIGKTSAIVLKARILNEAAWYEHLGGSQGKITAQELRAYAHKLKTR